MYYYTYVRFTILFAILDLGIISRAHNGCVVNKTHMEECNHCWCVDPGVPVCTKMDCTKVPELLKEETEAERKRSIFLGLGILAAVGAESWSVYNLIKAAQDYVKDMKG